MMEKKRCQKRKGRERCLKWNGKILEKERKDVRMGKMLEKERYWKRKICQKRKRKMLEKERRRKRKDVRKGKMLEKGKER